MVTNDDHAFERLLAALDWEVAASVRHRITAGRPVRIEPGVTTVVYVDTGTVASCLLGTGCAERLDGGDLAVTTGRTPGELHVLDGDEAVVVVTALRPAPGAEHLAAAFPHLLVVRGFAREEPAVAGLAASMGGAAGCDGVRLGEGAVCGRIASTIVAVALRSWSQRGCAPEDWLVRTRDPFVGRVLDAIHDEPGRAWTVGDLATVAAMSRTVFAERFRELVGQSPATYLTGVRMAAAMEHLGRGDLSVAATAALLGYESEAGFSRAFRRHTGATPSAWRRERVTAAAG